MSLFEELIEGKKKDKQIVKSFETKETLSDQIFEEKKGHFVMRDEIKKRLLEVSNDFIESLGVEFFIHDVVLTGSLANYNWSQYSDVDLHILIDFDELDKDSKKDSIALHSIMKEFFDAKKNVWNEKHEIKIKGYDVEIYVQDVNEEHISSGVYSILHNKWVLEPKKDKPNIDDRKILEKGEEFGKKIDRLIQTPKDITIDQLEDLRKKIKEFRQSGLESGGEYSYENLTFKLLRRNGYIQKLLRLKTQLTDKKLSITQ
jgi:predicted nucleotidyltransferase